MLRRIITFNPFTKRGNNILREKIKPVIDFDSDMVKNTIKDLNDTLDDLISKYGAKRAIGLSTPQINSNLRISVVELDSKRLILINPRIIKKSNKERLFRIGCFSSYGYRG